MGPATFRWDRSRRRQIEAELDAMVAVAYGLSRDDFSLLFDAFPVLEAREREEDGDFTSRRLALKVFDAFTASVGAWTPYRTGLTPPPADPRVTHPKRVVQ